MKRTVRQIIEYLQLSDEDVITQGEGQLHGTDSAYEYIAVASEGEATDQISGVSTDSRKIQQGELFVPLVGEHSDGHAYRHMAYERGSFVSIWDKRTALPEIPGIYLLVNDTLEALQTIAHQYRKSLTAKVIAITGSNGKTTTKDFLVSMLARQYKVHGTQGNLNNHIGVPLTLLGMEDDTEYAVIEMGMNHFGEIQRLTEIAEPDIGVITNIGESHIEHFGTRDAISYAKFELVQTMQSGTALINFDEPLLRQRVAEFLEPSDNSGPSLIGYGMSAPDARYRAKIVSHKKIIRSSSLLGLLDQTAQQSSDYTITTPGPHTIYNALAAIVAAKQCAVTDECIQNGLDQVKVTPMRMEITQIGSSHIINDAYNASPTSMKAVITYLSDIEEPYKKIALLGDMKELGESSEEYHYQIGQWLLEKAIDHIYAYGENARLYTQPLVENGRADAADYFRFGEEQALVSQLKREIAQGCILMVKGSRGMKMERFIQMINDGEDES